MHFNVDGLPLFKSSSEQLWPILCQIINKSCKPFIVGLYSGKLKPSDPHEYLSQFVDELQPLFDNGFLFNGKTFGLVVAGFICDAPARAYLKQIKGHNGYSSCEKC
uniref:Uncharacterized protein n=1 Tax=Capitella teleta TaxID=283909 RepID=X1YUT4_CAPTE